MKLIVASNRSTCLVLGYLILAQATTTKPALVAQAAGQSTAAATPSARGQSGAPDNSDKPVITIKGLCNHSMAATKAECKTVISQSEFESVLNAVDPGMPKHDRREFAEAYVDGLVMAAKAEQIGLDKGPSYEERMRYARIEILSQTLKRKIARESENVPDKDIEDFYHKNITNFEKAELERIYLPREPQSSSAIAGELPVEGSGGHLREAEQARRNEAEDLRARALKGEAFAKLQADAYVAAGIKSNPPGTTLSVRRIALPPDQTSVMDLKPGEVSGVLVNTNGYFIYKLKSKDTLPIEQIRNEIKEALQTKRLQDAMDDVMDSTSPTFDASYFKRY